MHKSQFICGVLIELQKYLLQCEYWRILGRSITHLFVQCKRRNRSRCNVFNASKKTTSPLSRETEIASFKQGIYGQENKEFGDNLHSHFERFYAHYNTEHKHIMKLQKLSWHKICSFQDSSAKEIPGKINKYIYLYIYIILCIYIMCWHVISFLSLKLSVHGVSLLRSGFLTSMKESRMPDSATDRKSCNASRYHSSPRTSSYLLCKVKVSTFWSVRLF